MQIFIQILVNGLALGSVYALVALGYTMVYGVLQFINFAHGEIFMLGAFAGVFLSAFLGDLIPSPWLQLTLITFGAMVFCTAIGLTVEKIAYRPLRKSPRLNVLITAIGVSLFLQNLGIVVFGSDPRFFPSIIATKPILSSEDLVITNIQLMVVIVSVVLMGVLHWMIHHTKVGTAMRAVSFNLEISSLMGIPSDRIIAFTFIVGSSLAGVAAILFGLSYPQVNPLMGLLIGIKAFVAAVFGGIGNIMGAAVGGLFIGLAEAFVVYYISSSYRDAIAFGVLTLVLLVRPTGIFGTVAREKV